MRCQRAATQARQSRPRHAAMRLHTKSLWPRNAIVFLRGNAMQDGLPIRSVRELLSYLGPSVR